MKSKNDIKKKASGALAFILLMGIVSLFSDMTHEGARSVIGEYLNITGASAATIGLVPDEALICPTGLIDQLVDWFGPYFSIREEKDEKIKVVLKASSQAMLYWAVQYCDCVEVTEPESLRIRIKEMLNMGAEIYNRFGATE